MPQLSPQRKISTIQLLLFGLVLFLGVSSFISGKLGITSTMLFISLLGGFIYLVSMVGFHKFDYSNKTIEITNTWFPFFYKRIDLELIDKVELTIVPKVGYSILFYFADGNKKVYGINAKKTDIEKMISVINSDLEKNR